MRSVAALIGSTDRDRDRPAHLCAECDSADRKYRDRDRRTQCARSVAALIRGTDRDRDRRTCVRSVAALIGGTEAETETGVLVRGV